MGYNLISKFEEALKEANIVELSHTLEEGMPVWPTHARFGAIVYETYDDGAISLHRQISFGEHSGTHMDAPKHFLKNGIGVDGLSVSQVMGRAVKIDASFLKPCEAYTLKMLKEFEEKNGEIKKGDIILLYFGWEDKYGLAKEAEEFLKDWPGLAGDAAKYLEEKEVKAVGTDALALDPFGSQAYPCHYILLGKNIPILENLMNLKNIPVFSFVIGLAPSIRNGSASPIRMVAFVEK